MKRARDYGLVCGTLPMGALNAITDVAGVKIGHVTLDRADVHTGVTCILPHDGNLFRRKVPAAVEIINGFGKSTGLMQVNELGNLETPILLTNTLNVPVCATALIRRAIAENPDIGRESGTVNPLVFECNDGWLNDIQALAVTEADALAVIDGARDGSVAEGAVGAGRGMSCFGFKSGIGTASRVVACGPETFTLGALVLANFGRAGDLQLPDGRRAAPPTEPAPERGSVIIILATDAPLDHRQLRRIARRGGAGIARLGAFWGNGSGDVALAFSTAATFDHDEARAVVPHAILNEAHIDGLFQAAAEATQEAVLNALCAAPALTGRAGHHRPSLADWLKGNCP